MWSGWTSAASRSRQSKSALFLCQQLPQADEQQKGTKTPVQQLYIQSGRYPGRRRRARQSSQDGRHGGFCPDNRF